MKYLVLLLLYESIFCQNVNDLLISSSSVHPDLTIDRNNNLHIVWVPNRVESSEEIGYAIYAPQFTQLIDSISIPTFTTLKYTPKISIQDSIVNVVWTDVNIHNSHISGTLFNYSDLNGFPRIIYSDNSGSDGGRGNPKVCYLSDSTYFVIWTGVGKLNVPSSIYGQLCKTTGEFIGSNFALNDHDQNSTDSYRRSKSVQVIPFLNNKGFIIFWIDNSTGKDEIYGRIFDANGNPIEQSFLVSNNPNLSELFSLAIDRSSTQNIVVVWSIIEDSRWVVQKRWYNSSGKPNTDIITVTENDGNVDDYSKVDVSIQTDDKSIVIWEENENNDSRLYAQRYGADDNKIGKPFKISNSQRAASQLNPIIKLKEDIISVCWQESGSSIWASSFSFNNPPTGMTKNISEQLIKNFELFSNYPNPFNPSTTISYRITKRGIVSLVIYDILGNKIKTILHNESEMRGHHTQVWDGRNDAGNSVKSGVYLVKLIYGNSSSVKKLLLLK